MKGILMAIILLGVGGCATDPEFLNCQVEIITVRGDTLKIDSALVEFEGSSELTYENALTDNVLIIKGNGRWSFPERDIVKMTIIYEAPK